MLFRAHEDTQFTRDGLRSLRASLAGYDVVVASYLKEAPPRTGIFENAYIVTATDVVQLPYEAKLRGFNPDDATGFSEIAPMAFFRDHPDYDFYWIVEFDVAYSGNWSELFATLSHSTADFLSTTIQTKGADNAEWCHWPSLALAGDPLPAQHCLSSFMPFVRVSRAALRAIDELYIMGLNGHSEATWPSACAMRGLTIEDLGGDGPYTPENWRGKHYTNSPSRHWALSPGTFVFRPVLTEGDVAATGLMSMLWHPVKS